MKKIALLLIFVFAHIAGRTQNVIITGRCDNDSLGHMSIFESLPFRWSELNQEKRTMIAKEHGVFRIEFDVDSVIIKHISPPGYSRSQEVFLTAGDSLTFTIEKDNEIKGAYYLVFSGKNAAHYNYFRLRDDTFRKYPSYKEYGSFREYRDSLDAFYGRQTAFLNDYIKDNQVLESFKNYAASQIINWHAYDLFNTIVSYPQSVTPEEAEKLFDETPLRRNTPSYLLALSYKYIYRYTENSSFPFDQVYSNIMQIGDKGDRDYLLSNMAGVYALMQSTENRDGLLMLTEELLGTLENPQYIEYVRRVREYAAVLNQPLPESVLTGIYLQQFGSREKISLKELLAKYEDKPVYIDFWASWCAPCRFDIANSGQSKEYLKENGFEYVYIAYRDKEESWEKAVEEENIAGNQYLMLDSANYPLVSLLSINYIPRYVLLNAKHHVVNANAARPTPEHFEQLKRDVNKCLNKQRKVTYY